MNFNVFRIEGMEPPETLSPEEFSREEGMSTPAGKYLMHSVDSDPQSHAIVNSHATHNL